MAKTQKSRPTRPHDPTALGRNFKRRLQSGDLLLGGIAAEYLRPSLVKIYAHAGYDFIFIDKEHSYFDGPEMTDFVLSARTTISRSFPRSANCTAPKWHACSKPGWSPSSCRAPKRATRCWSWPTT